MFPAKGSPGKRWRAAANGGKDNTSRLQWLFRGLPSVFGAQLDHPVGPPGSFTDTHVPTRTHGRRRSHTESGSSNILTLCYLLLASFVCMDRLEPPFVVAVFGDTLKGGGESTNSKCTSWLADGPLERRRLLNHKMNRWCET